MWISMAKLNRVGLFLLLISLFSIQAKALDQYVFAVKGGISLGSYEAGLNWAYIEHLRLLRKQNKARLDSFVGASAGSINTLLSALRYCQKDSTVSTRASLELFRKTWDVGIQDFIEMPGNKSQKPTTDIDDNLLENRGGSIFSLQGLKRSVDFIRTQIRLSENNLIDNCQFNIGIAVTKLTPDATEIAGIEVLNQRYIFPLKVSTKNGKLVFSNLAANNPAFTRQDNYLYLPESNSEVVLDDVLRVVLASSAFPLTFPPVELNYCKKNENSSLTSIQCPQGYSIQNNQFIDGGNFDNAPIGSAMRINDPHEEHKDSVFILINPGNIRNRDSQANKSTKDQKPTSVTPGIKEYLELSYNIFDHGMSAELYQTARNVERLQQKSNSNRPSIQVTNRYFPVVGDYLMHFGAFFDKSFRQHDFWVGIYDGIVNIAESNCKNIQPRNSAQYFKCIDSQTNKISDQLNINHQPEFSFFTHLLQREFSRYQNTDEWKKNINAEEKSDENKQAMIVISQAIDENSCESEPDINNCKKPRAVSSFDSFLENLHKHDPLLTKYEPYTQHIIKDKRGWKYPILNAAINRLYTLEREKYLSTKSSSKDWIDQKSIFDLLKMSTYVGKTYLAKSETGLWPNSTLGHSKSFLSIFVPDEIGISYRQTSVYVKYKTESLISRKKFPIGFESRFIPINLTSRTRDVNQFMGAEFIVKAHTPNPLFSTFGIGYGYYNVDFYNNSSPSSIANSFFNPLHGIILDMGAIAGKIKIAFIYRGSKINSDNRGYVNWAVNLGLNDIKGLRWLW